MQPDARAVIDALGLAPHPEGGFFRETYRATAIVGGLAHGGSRNASTAIYFLLPRGSFSALHRVRSDEVWHHYQGDPLDLHVFEEGVHERVRLGQAILDGERPQQVVRAGAWQAAVPCGESYTLCGCTVAPGFDFADFEMPPREDLLRLLPGYEELVVRLTYASAAADERGAGA